MSQDDELADAPQAPDAQSTHYIKGQYFRVIHADGAYGGTTQRGYLHATFFNERKAIPREMIGGDVVDTRGGIVRELEVDVVMDINTAVEFHRWLTRHLETLRQRIGVPDEVWEDMKRGSDG